MRATLRLIAAFLILIAGLLLGTTVLAAAGAPDRWAYALAGVCYALGLLLAQGMLRWRAGQMVAPVRRAVLVPLAFAAAAEAFMLSALPWPITGLEASQVWPLGLAFAPTLTAMALAARRAPAVRWCLAPLALWGAWIIGRLFWWFPADRLEQGGPGSALSTLLVFTLGLTLIAAFWGGRPLWRQGARSGAAV